MSQLVPNIPVLCNITVDLKLPAYIKSRKWDHIHPTQLQTPTSRINP